MKKGILILILMILALFSVSCIYAADVNDSLVASEDTNQIELSDSDKVIEDNLQTTEENDELTLTDNDVLGADSATYSDLAAEIGQSGNVKLTHKNYTYNDGATAITITEANKVIDGDGAVIDMAGSTIRAFTISTSGVTIKNLTIKNANYNGNGGAIYFSSSGTVTNCNFTDNKAGRDGGAIYMYFGSVENCNFTNNKAGRDGGAIMFVNTGTVSNCNFTNNQATGTNSWGGAIRFVSTGTVTNCNFTDNTAGDWGGAIMFVNNGTVSNCNFTNNQADEGGAIYFSSSGTVTNCNFTDNKAGRDGGAIRFVNNGTVSNCNFTNNQADEGGAIYFKHTGNVTNCNFADNSASRGGAIFSFYWYTAADTCIFKRNSGDNVNVVIYPPTLNVDNFTTFYGSGEKLTFNLTTDSGMPVNNGNISISVYFKDNNSWVGNYSCLSGEGWTVDLPAGLYYAVFNTEYAEFKPINRTITIIPDTSFWVLNHTINANDTSEVNLTNDYCYDPDFDGEFADGIVINRQVTINGNGCTINANGKARIFQVNFNDGVLLNDINFINGNTAGNGGAVNFVDRGNVTNCNFTGNNATSRGGAICCNAVCFVTNCNFINNNATLGNGGALWAMAAKVVNCNFTDNFALHHGGACWIYSGIVSGSDFIGNVVVTGSGGALRFTEEGDVTNCNFTNNSANNGGAIICTGAGDLTNCNFKSNTAISEDGGAAHIMLKGNVRNCNFTDNEAAKNGGAIFFENNGKVLDCNFVNNKASSRYGGAISMFEGNVANCNFTDNSAGLQGGAVYSQRNATVENSNFIGNNANNGGAIHTSPMCYGNVAGCSFANNSAFNGGAANIYIGIIKNCNFTDNHATNAGGAVVFSEDGSFADCTFEANTASHGGAISMFEGNVANCNFTGNNATKGSAINFNGFTGINISNSCFLNNRANASAYDSFDVTVNGTALEIAFIGQNNHLNAIYSKGNIKFTNVTYWGANGIANTGDSPIELSPSNCEAGQNISISGIVNGKIINTSEVTDGNGKIILENASDYYLVVRHESNSYYTEAEKEISNMNVKVTSQETTDMTVNITAKSNIPQDIIRGKLVFILPNGTEINATYGTDGIWWAVHTFDAIGEYNVGASYHGLDNVAVSNATVSVKAKTVLTGKSVTATYNINKDLVITLKDANGNPLTGVNLKVDLNGAKTYTTDSNGQVKVSTKGLAPNVYTAKVTFDGNTNYDKSALDVKVTVNKATPKLTAKKKTFKSTVKTKKYTVTLKDNLGKAIKKAKVTLKVNGKTYKATTNSKGQATFKITKLTKKGTYSAVVTYAGNKYFNKVTKKAKITVKSTFKTVSKGSKDKTTVKKIQRALKNNGYYLTYAGHYLMVDGIYDSCTVRSVKEFQADKGLKVTGKVDEKTAKKLGLI